MDDRELAEWVADARARTLALVADLDDAQLMGPRLAIVNPLLWEIGHVGWFQDHWVFGGGRDELYDSSAIPHDTRWDLPLPDRAATVRSLEETRDRVLERLARGLSDEERYFVRLSVFHEDMHDEAFTYTRHTLGYRAPDGPRAEPPPGGPLPGDAHVPGTTLELGARPGAEPFVFDNEKWAHAVEVAPFAIARAAVSEGDFAAFVDDDGYARRELWSVGGWAWRVAAGAEAPIYWRRDGRSWVRREFDRWRPLDPHRALIHVAWWEAEAYCKWAGRRLPTEAEWELAAGGPEKRRFPWGEARPDDARANLGWRRGRPVDVGALGDGDTPEGCRQMIGNVWEWTSTTFAPYPGFVADPYRDYSQPWFGTHKVLRGGCWATAPRLLRNSWRNFYTPDRRDVWAGFRTCAA